MNRTNRSGILNGGVIGGRDQTGHWKIDARFNRAELIARIEAIAKMNGRIQLTRMDALKFLETKSGDWPAKTLIYLDPPYYMKGRELYYDFYEPKDHENVERFVTKKLGRRNWIVSYDNVPSIRTLYKGYQQIVYGIGYSARDVREGSEIMFFSDALQMPLLTGPFRLIRRLPVGQRVSARTEKKPYKSIAKRKFRSRKAASV